MAGRTMTFDSFECAIQALAPTCPHCGNRIIGHGVEPNRLDSRSPRTAASGPDGDLSGQGRAHPVCLEC
jgi:hypothetical protein